MDGPMEGCATMEQALASDDLDAGEESVENLTELLRQMQMNRIRLEAMLTTNASLIETRDRLQVMPACGPAARTPTPRSGGLYLRLPHPTRRHPVCHGAITLIPPASVASEHGRAG